MEEVTSLKEILGHILSDLAKNDELLQDKESCEFEFVVKGPAAKVLSLYSRLKQGKNLRVTSVRGGLKFSGSGSRSLLTTFPDLLDHLDSSLRFEGYDSNLGERLMNHYILIGNRLVHETKRYEVFPLNRFASRREAEQSLHRDIPVKTWKDFAAVGDGSKFPDEEDNFYRHGGIGGFDWVYTIV